MTRATFDGCGRFVLAPTPTRFAEASRDQTLRRVDEEEERDELDGDDSLTKPVAARDGWNSVKDEDDPR